jgi:hypothetical protein
MWGCTNTYSCPSNYCPDHMGVRQVVCKSVQFGLWILLLLCKGVYLTCPIWHMPLGLIRNITFCIRFVSNRPFWLKMCCLWQVLDDSVQNELYPKDLISNQVDCKSVVMCRMERTCQWRAWEYGLTCIRVNFWSLGSNCSYHTPLMFSEKYLSFPAVVPELHSPTIPIFCVLITLEHQRLSPPKRANLKWASRGKTFRPSLVTSFNSIEIYNHVLQCKNFQL